MSSSIILHMDDKANYFGLVLKTGSGRLAVARPEGKGLEPPASSEAGAKPVLLREPCDLCGGEPRCARVCPTRCIAVEG